MHGVTMKFMSWGTYLDLRDWRIKGVRKRMRIASRRGADLHTNLMLQRFCSCPLSLKQRYNGTWWKSGNRKIGIRTAEWTEIIKIIRHKIKLKNLTIFCKDSLTQLLRRFVLPLSILFMSKKKKTRQTDWMYDLHIMEWERATKCTVIFVFIAPPHLMLLYCLWRNIQIRG